MRSIFLSALGGEIQRKLRRIQEETVGQTALPGRVRRAFKAEQILKG